VDSGIIAAVQRPGYVVAAALVASVAAMLGGSAGAQSPASVTITPLEADPGGRVVVTNGPGSPCIPPLGAVSASASVDLFGPGSATPANRVPYQGRVGPTGSWSVEVRLAPDLPPGRYRVQAGCYTDSGLNSGFGPPYEPARLEVRLQDLGQSMVGPRAARAGDSVQVTSNEVRCTPPVGAPSPRVRVSLVDSSGATRAESEGGVDPAGRWSVPVRVPSLDAQDVQVTAVCLARVGASSPYASYAGSPFTIQAAAQTDPPATPSTSPGPAPTSAVTVPGAATTTTNPALVAASSLPATPVASAIVAEPTYTG